MSLNPSPSVYPRVNGSLVVVAGGCPLLAGGERGGARVDQLEEFHLTLRAGSATAHWQQVDISLTISPLAWSFAACRLEDCHEDQQTGDLVGGGNQELREDLASQTIYLSDGSHVTEPPTTQPEIFFVIDETGDLLYDFSINSTGNSEGSSDEDEEETSPAPVTFLDYEQTTTEESGLTFEHSSESSSEELRYTVEPSLDGDESVQFGEYGVEQTTREESVFTLERSSEEVWYTVEPSPEEDESVQSREHGDTTESGYYQNEISTPGLPIGTSESSISRDVNTISTVFQDQEHDDWSSESGSTFSLSHNFELTTDGSDHLTFEVSSSAPLNVTSYQETGEVTFQLTDRESGTELGPPPAPSDFSSSSQDQDSQGDITFSLI